MESPGCNLFAEVKRNFFSILGLLQLRRGHACCPLVGTSAGISGLHSRPLRWVIFRFAAALPSHHTNCWLGAYNQRPHLTQLKTPPTQTALSAHRSWSGGHRKKHLRFLSLNSPLLKSPNRGSLPSQGTLVMPTFNPWGCSQRLALRGTLLQTPG